MRSETARAKINLTLHVGRVIENQVDAFYGYHPIDSLVVFADIGDVLSCEAATETSLSIIGPFADDLPVDDGNLIIKAVHVVDRTQDHPPLKFTLEKNLPVAAGIGGGSANAAAALRLLQDYVELTAAQWTEIALKIGADVPVCLMSETARMTGIGESLSPAPGLGQVYTVLVNPGVKVMTKDVFKVFDKGAPNDTPRPAKTEGDLLSRALAGRNDLESPSMTLAPEISDCLRAIAALQGCQLARMSGSGATCFGIFERKSEALRAAENLAKSHPLWWVQFAVLGDALT